MQRSELLKASATGDAVEDAGDFSLVLGGPLYQLYLRTKLLKPPLDLVRRRIFGLWLIFWLVPLVLALLEGHEFGGVSVPFLLDAGAHVRFLGALPLLTAAELIVHTRIRGIVQQFLERGIIALEDRARFEKLVTSVLRLRNSILIEVLLLVFAFSAGHWVNTNPPLGVDTWYAVRISGITHLTAAGYWYAFVSLPIFRFIVLRWGYRLFIWYWFLWHVRRLPLHLNLFHPDRAGGLGFLSGSVLAFEPVLVAQTILLAGMIGNRIWHAGATLPSFKMEIVGVVVFLMLLALTPLSFFVVQLGHAGRAANREFGILASHYVDDFHLKWIERHGADGEPLLGTPDIQSLADLGNVYSVVSKMRIVPVSKDAVIRLALVIILPLLPLTLTMIPLERIIDQLFKLMF
jgi:hypothetical protein